ncbi:hypothetical protein EHI8A_031820 [Entamoeba histolytica HM-1:IMSS-B]|uniref:Uncharacterized protein n=6 Tax=Entamoeba histolytica TaxID=5759 RepID=C4LT27_ENTH1|nr:hypothetical protein EHI_148570 [Entamoeba histolytica HM-1:IMSS]EMD45733.1 Hypothetical protein EHI5A_062800 [Entamoeba histolytica KU27]EMH77761.1 hypothetical protein EHI8A_031820 [Entamoeba histolytica HM-1:IMSS-B]EMS14682.1 hypothetical protein KM1_073020 [Entamoeba histolytica HM-3:IMSS]ENY63773.1 hypothetical protein EHI7A_034780 [Entamoeba histolytica HM-1:IMSS-A]GAT91695.1 hypothetical protein CL6EHI_148570 [Entamoeba histolytica]|eukprot:XP_657482.2 hypothetical protein EHI_148570 [Entamoeba histolytica HM-1:IMSS]
MSSSNIELQNQLNSFKTDMNSARQAMGQRLSNLSEQFTKQCQAITKNYGQNTESFAEGLVHIIPSQAEILAGQQEIPTMSKQQSVELLHIVEGGIQRIEEINKSLTDVLKNSTAIEKLRKIKEETQTINNVLAKQDDEMKEIYSMYSNLERRQRELAEKFEKVAKEDLLQANVSRQDDLNIIQKDALNQSLNKKQPSYQSEQSTIPKTPITKDAIQKQTVPLQLMQDMQAIPPLPQQKMNKQLTPKVQEQQKPDTTLKKQSSKRLIDSQLANNVLDDFCTDQIMSQANNQPIIIQQAQQPKKLTETIKKESTEERCVDIQPTNTQQLTEPIQKGNQYDQHTLQRTQQKKPMVLPSVQNNSIPRRGQLKQRPQSRVADNRPQSRVGDTKLQSSMRNTSTAYRLGNSQPYRIVEQQMNQQNIQGLTDQFNDITNQLEPLQSQQEDLINTDPYYDSEINNENYHFDEEVYPYSESYDQDQYYKNGILYDDYNNDYQQLSYIPQQRIIYVPMQQVIDPYTGQVIMQPVSYTQPIYQPPLNQYMVPLMQPPYDPSPMRRPRRSPVAYHQMVPQQFRRQNQSMRYAQPYNYPM